MRFSGNSGNFCDDSYFVIKSQRHSLPPIVI
jgi:hypothetical protein